MEKKAKIIATLGPAIYSNTKLKQLVSLGVDAFRINFSHKTQGINRIVSRIRKIEKSSNKILLNEINTIPGFTKNSMFPMLWEASGLKIEQLVAKMVDISFDL